MQQLTPANSFLLQRPRQIDQYLLTIVADRKVHEGACFDGARSWKTVQNLGPMAVQVGTRRGPILVMIGSVQIEMNPLNEAGRDAAFRDLYIDLAPCHRKSPGP